MAEQKKKFWLSVRQSVCLFVLFRSVRFSEFLVLRWFARGGAPAPRSIWIWKKYLCLRFLSELLCFGVCGHFSLNFFVGFFIEIVAISSDSDSDKSLAVGGKDPANVRKRPFVLHFNEKYVFRV